MLIFAIFACSALLCTLLRFAQLGSLDFATGFYNNGTLLPAAVYVTALLTFIVLICVAVRAAQAARDYRTSRTTAVPFFRRGFGTLSRGIASVAGGVYIFVEVVLVTGIFSAASGFEIVTAVLRTVGFGLLAHNLLYRKKTRLSAGFALLPVAISYVLSAITVFQTHIIIRHTSSPLTQMITHLAFAFFYFYMGRVLSRTEERVASPAKVFALLGNARVRAVALGLTAAALVISESLAVWVYLALNTQVAQELAAIPADGVLVPTLGYFAEGVAPVLLLLTFNTLRRRGD